MIQALIGPATKLLGKFIEDKDTKNKLAHDIATMAEKHAQELAKSQIEVKRWKHNQVIGLLQVGDLLLVGCVALLWHGTLS